MPLHFIFVFLKEANPGLDGFYFLFALLFLHYLFKTLNAKLMKMHVGDKIRKVRELKGYKQEYVADQLNMSVTAYGNLERGDSSPSFDRLEEIAKVLEVEVVDILNIPDQLNIHSICNSSNIGIGFSQTGPNYNGQNGDRDSPETIALKETIAYQHKEIEYLREQIRQFMEIVGKR